MSSVQRFWVDWFRQANVLAKYASAMDQRAAIEASKNSGFYPRDIILKAMRGRLYWWTTPDGFKWYPMAAVTDISEALDVVTQRVGSLLVRAGDRWRDAAPGNSGDILTHQGDDAPPAWSPGGGGGGGGQQVVPGTPITFDGTQTFYDLPVSTYSEVLISVTDTSLSAAEAIVYRLSTDGGVNYRFGLNDYFSSVYSNLTREHALKRFLRATVTNVASIHWHQINFKNLRIGQTVLSGQSSVSLTGGGSIGGGAQFDSPVTHIRILTGNVSVFSSGALRAIGTLA